MDENLQEDWLDARLRDEAPYIDDAGFTARVVQKLPARPVRHSLRAVILLGVTLVASVIAYLLSDGGWFIAEEVTRFARLPLPVIWLGARAGDRPGHGRRSCRRDVSDERTAIDRERSRALPPRHARSAPRAPPRSRTFVRA